MAGSSWPPTDSLWETQVLTVGICVAQGEEKLGLYRCLRLDHPKPAVLASLEQYVPSVLGHDIHSQSPGAATKWWLAGSAQGNYVGGLWSSVPHRSGWGPQPPYF